MTAKSLFPQTLQHLARASRRFAPAAALALPLIALSQTDISTVPLPTYSISSSVDIKPNILMVLDDSGSMDFNYMPDWADDTPWNYSSLPEYLTRNSAFNGLAYNPAVVYQPPITFTAAGVKDTTTYPSQTGASGATGADASARPNWRAVKNDAFGVQSTGTSNLTTSAFFWVTVPGEFCDSPGMTGCTTTTTATGNYSYPAPLRWCSDTALTTCRALQDSTFRYPRIAAPRVAHITFTGANNATISGITIGGVQVMSSSSTNTSNNGTLATSVASRINACANAATGNCGTYGFTAVASSNGVVTIMAPNVIATTPVATIGAGTVGVATTSFAATTIPFGGYINGTPNVSSAAVPGITYRVAINSGNNSYPYPGSATKAASRTDCAGTTCTFQEEMTNYANWHTYYRTRMQMMKTATSRAFATLDSDAEIAAGTSRYRVGYLSINNNTGADFVNLNEFGSAQKFTWYSKLFAADPENSTPLRTALSTAGRLYAGKLNGDTLNGSVVTDPMQYSCQKNFTILSTDGFWNGGGGVKLDGSSSIGNHDGALPRPYSDGATVQAQTRTRQLQQRTVTQFGQQGTLQAQTSQLQKLESQLQFQESQLQIQTLKEYRTSTNSGTTWSAWQPWTDVTTDCSNDNSGSTRRQCQNATSGWSNTTACRDNGWMNCRYVAGAWTNAVGTCTVVNQSSGNTNWAQPARACRYVDGAWTNTGACAAVAKSGSSPYSVVLARSCQTVVTAAYANSPTCAVTAPNGAGVSTQCRYNFTAAVPTQCTPAYVANNFTNPTVWNNCSPSNGAWTNTPTCTETTAYDANGEKTECRYTTFTGWSNVASCSAVAASPASPYTVEVVRECQTLTSGGNSNTLADVAAYYYYTDLRSTVAADGTGTCTGPVIAPATTANDLCEDNVIPYGRDTNSKQHMTTHTLGLGVQGMMVYSPYQNNSSGQRVYVPDYWTQPSGDFYAVASGSTANPGAGICSWLGSGNTCNWPSPSADSIANIDDLWHAAVNGHGTYFSATDPATLADALKNVLAQIISIPRPGTAAAAASSNPNVTDTDNYSFSSSYKSIDWYGELIMERINANGSRTPQQWSAMRLLDCATTPWQANKAWLAGQTYSHGGQCFVVNADYTSLGTYGPDPDGNNTTLITGSPVTRKVYYKKGSAIAEFNWTNLNGTTDADYFRAPYINFVSASQGLTQFCSSGSSCMSAAAQTSAQGEPLVNYLRGDRTNEGTYFRARKRVLGDIVSSQAKYVKIPLQNYADPGFSAFKATQSTLPDTVYVGGNDGMLHAFNALTGEERWAFIPTSVLPEIYRLADNDYTNKHRFFVDGSPQVDYICPKDPPATCAANEWKTILVGGLNDGGSAYYALDITDPLVPTVLWEFSNANLTSSAKLGLSYTKPVITKLRDGTWVVLVASGYNNSDGGGHLFVIKASDGSLIRTISTGVGTPASPAGLAKITGYVGNYSVNNTTEYAYGGDLYGNVWRFDVNDNVGTPGYEAHRLVTLKDSANAAQPITATPLTATVGTNPMIIVGTGKYLGLTDLTNNQVQTVYAIKDKLDDVSLPDPRATGSNFVNQSPTTGTCPTDAPATVCAQGQTVTLGGTNAVDWGIRNGWYADLGNAAGERAVTDLRLVLGTLVFTTIKPQSSTNNVVLGCTGSDQGINAKSYFYQMNYLNGMAVSGTHGVTSFELCVCVATSPSLIKTQDGTVRAIVRVSGQTGDGTDMGGTLSPPVTTEGGTHPTRRISWRELTN